MENSLNILKAREERIHIIESLISEYNIVLAKVNMFGENKNNNFAKSILGILIRYLENDDFFSFVKYNYYESDDGPFIIYKFPLSVLNIKEKCIELEEKLPYGRLIDLDCFINSCESINRIHKRKCIICDDYAYNCIRNKKHIKSELINKYKELSINSFIDLIEKAYLFSTKKELELDPKFGCVTIKTNGSHKDLNYDLMIKCVNLLKSYFIDMFKVGFLSSNDYFSKINKIGRIAEKDMFDTIGTNCYKGLIFILGIIITSMGIYLSSFDSISFKDSINEVIKDIDFEIKNDSFGYYAYKELGFGGIRKETKESFPTIEKYINTFDINDDKSIYRLFINIILSTDDTVLLKRSGSIEKYNYYKELIRNLDINNLDDLNRINQECIDNLISFGGSCDILIATLFIKYIMNFISIKE